MLVTQDVSIRHPSDFCTPPEQNNASKTIAVVLPRECCKESTSVDCDYETYGNDSFRASVSFLQSSKSAFIEHENAARNENSRG